MRKLTLLPIFCIQLFAEGSGTGAGTAGEGPAAADSAPAMPSGVKGNPLADVKYGKQESAPAAGEQVADDRADRFESLIKGEFKDLYDQRVQDTIQKRLKSTNDTVARYNELSPVLDMLAEKYGVDRNDVQALVKAVEDDDTYFENEAIERGLTVQQVKEIRKMERENAALRAQMEQAQRQQEADRIYSRWMEQAEAMKPVYPGFDLQAELNNDQFRNLLMSNIDVRTAFEVVHKDEILPAAMQYTAQRVTEKVANNVRAGMARPKDGAAGGRTGAVETKSDVSKLTKEDRAEIRRRVNRGERIVF